ncbi:unnamed protein product [Eruca vesicaria subsp. sativa]|uniref:HMG box domain-containing protein n=1 Tax=Eruca vesicaria subsp. sativa TaxID=29727 RepID=A0ABC8IV54_ERUVS|nr:unnamed protein product [Eruca vesicaria subsp. sativa]
MSENIPPKPYCSLSLIKLVSDAWCVLSDASRKSIYDRELQLSQLGQRCSQPEEFQCRQESKTETSEKNHKEAATSFWTAAFEAVKTETPPVESNGEGVYVFCSWAMFPVGFLGEAKRSGSGWSPVSNLFHCPVHGSSDYQANLETPAPRNYHDVDNGDGFYITISDDDNDDDDEERDVAKKKKKGG